MNADVVFKLDILAAKVIAAVHNGSHRPQLLHGGDQIWIRLRAAAACKPIIGGRNRDVGRR